MFTKKLCCMLCFFINVFFVFTMLVISIATATDRTDIIIAKENWLDLRSNSNRLNQEKLELLTWSNSSNNIFSDLPLVGNNGEFDEAALTLSLTLVSRIASHELTNSQKKQIEDSMLKVSKEYKVGRIKSGNWWHWEIGIPSQINHILLLTESWLDPELFSNLLKASHYYLPKPDFQNAGESSTGNASLNTGANRVDTVLIVLQRALLEQDAEAFSEALEKLWYVVEYVDTEDGFYVDGGYIQHRDIPYVGSYGLVLFDGLNDIFALVKDTKWQPGVDVFHHVMDLYEAALFPFTYEGRVLDLVAGRSVSRGWEQADSRGIKLLRLFNDFYKSAPTELEERITDAIESIKTKSDNFKAFLVPSIDRFAYHSPTYISAIAMHSARTGNFECLNNENLKGWYTGDGMMYLQMHNNDYVDIWPLIDATSPPGTTTDSQPLEPCAGQSNRYNRPLKSQHWVGGAVSKHYAAIGMDFQSVNGKVAAKKSWFYLPDRIVAVGTEIKGANNTNIFQRFAGEAEYLSWETLKDNEVFWLDNSQLNVSLGVLLPYLQQHKFLLEHVKGDWQDINKSSERHMDDTQISGWRARFDLQHDQNETSDYAYILLPNLTRQEVENFSKNVDIEILSNESLFHAVWHKKGNIYLANNFSSGSNELVPGKLSIKGSSSILVHINENVIDISVADPEMAEKPIELQFTRDVNLVQSCERVTVHDNIVLINTSGLKGRSVQFSLHSSN